MESTNKPFVQLRRGSLPAVPSRLLIFPAAPHPRLFPGSSLKAAPFQRASRSLFQITQLYMVSDDAVKVCNILVAFCVAVHVVEHFPVIPFFIFHQMLILVIRSIGPAGWAVSVFDILSYGRIEADPSLPAASHPSAHSWSSPRQRSDSGKPAFCQMSKRGIFQHLVNHGDLSSFCIFLHVHILLWLYIPFKTVHIPFKTV